MNKWIASWISNARGFRLVPAIGGTRYFHLELGNRYRWYIEPVRWGLIVLSCALFACILWNVVHVANVWSSRHEMQARLDHARELDQDLLVRVRQEGVDLSPSSLQRLPAEIRLANQLLAKRNFSWTQFLSGLEDAIPQHVSIKSIRLDSTSAVIHLTGAAVTVEDVTTLALKLQDHPVFRDPVLGQHHTGVDGLVEFDLSLKYRPQTS
ncbi:MAG TPA: PilN domain-containing protein [Nitrospira sp.]|nr:PilN domain-containing protein [Nitrospira sp.]